MNNYAFDIDIILANGKPINYVEFKLFEQIETGTGCSTLLYLLHSELSSFHHFQNMYFRYIHSTCFAAVLESSPPRTESSEAAYVLSECKV